MAKSPTFLTKTSKKRHKKGLKPADGESGATSVRGHAASLESDNQRLYHRVAALEKELEHCKREISKAAAQEVGAEKLLAQQFVATELQHGDLASLYVASTRLQSSLKRQDILAAIREIASNLIGAEEMALFEVDHLNSQLLLADGFGSHAKKFSQIGLGEGPIGRVASSGEHFFHDVNGAEQERGNERIPTACIPLKVGGEVWGVIVIFRLLPQKERLVALDYQLVELLSNQAGIALYCANLARERLSSAKIIA